MFIAASSKGELRALRMAPGFACGGFSRARRFYPFSFDFYGKKPQGLFGPAVLRFFML
jgi:hypothetical protein